MDITRVTICVLTYNRKALFLRTISSMFNAGHPHNLIVVDNGSTDGTADIVKDMRGVCNRSDNHSTGYGMNLAIKAALETNPELILISADDFQYKPDWLLKLASFWYECSQSVIMASCYLEPSWNWNEITETGYAGGQRYAIRDSIPGSNWSFRASDWTSVYPIEERTGGEDLNICRRLRGQGYKLAALDLVEHIGEQESAWGNESWRYAKPLDKVSLGFENG